MNERKSEKHRLHPIHLLIIIGIMLIVLMSVVLYQQSIHTVCLEGVVDTVDEQKVIIFHPFKEFSPGQLDLPDEYDFEDGENVKCTLIVYDVSELRRYKIKDISLGN